MLPKGETLNKEKYCEFLDELKEAIFVKRRRNLAIDHNINFLQDNAPPHVARLTVNKLIEINLPALPHSPYSPDVAPSDYYLFSSLKSSFQGKTFNSELEVANAISLWIQSKSPDFFAKGISLLPERWQKVIDFNGDYFD